jgi:hypothetical protein
MYSISKIIFLLLFVIGSGFSNNLIANERKFESIKNEIIQQWRVYLKRIPSHEGTCSKRISGQIKGDVRFENIYRFKYDEYPNFNYEQKQNELLNLTSFNKKYFFRLNKDKDKNWAVLDINNNSMRYDNIAYFIDNANNIEFYIKNYNLLNSIAPSLILFRTWLPDIFTSQDFHIEEINDVVEDNYEMLKVIYKYEPSTEHGYRNIRSGILYLLKNHYYLVKKADFDYFDTSFVPRDKANLINDFSFETDGVPMLVNQTIKAPKGIDGAWSFTFKISELVKHDFSQSEFYLSHYGLPEPDFGERRTKRGRYISVGLGLLMMIIGAWRMIRERRKRF